MILETTQHQRERWIIGWKKLGDFGLGGVWSEHENVLSRRVWVCSNRTLPTIVEGNTSNENCDPNNSVLRTKLQRFDAFVASQHEKRNDDCNRWLKISSMARWFANIETRLLWKVVSRRTLETEGLHYINSHSAVDSWHCRAPTARLPPDQSPLAQLSNHPPFSSLHESQTRHQRLHKTTCQSCLGSSSGSLSGSKPGEAGRSCSVCKQMFCHWFLKAATAHEPESFQVTIELTGQTVWT